MLENWTLRSVEGIMELLLIYAGVALMKTKNTVPRRVLELPLLLGLIYSKMHCGPCSYFPCHWETASTGDSSSTEETML